LASTEKVIFLNRAVLPKLGVFEYIAMRDFSQVQPNHVDWCWAIFSYGKLPQAPFNQFSLIRFKHRLRSGEEDVAG